MIQSPRSRFLSDKSAVHDHNKILDSTMYQRSEDAAFAEFSKALIALGGSQKLDAPNNQQAAAAVYYMMVGAQNYLEVFHKLATPYPVADKPEKIQSLTELEKQ